MYKCLNCEDEGWVCENHSNVPWRVDNCCGGAGEPCKFCNMTDKNTPPRMPPGFKTIKEREPGQ